MSEHVPMRHRRSPLAQRVIDLIGTEWCGNGAPPLTNRKLYVKDDGVHRVFATVDDGGFTGIGYPDKWHVIMRTEAARAFALWTLWVWACDWFGLRSAIYFRALQRQTRGSWRLDYKRRGRWRRNVQRSSHDAWWNEEHPPRDDRKPRDERTKA